MEFTFERNLAQIFGKTNNESCAIFECSNSTVSYGSVGDIINPFMFFTNNDSLCNYANIESCCNLEVSGSSFTGFLKPFCLDLLPFCIFYSFMRVIISIVNYIFIYRKKIEKEALRDNYHLITGHDNTNKKDAQVLQNILRLSFIMDIVNATISFTLFKGYQFYASVFSHDFKSTDDRYWLLLLGNWN